MHGTHSWLLRQSNFRYKRCLSIVYDKLQMEQLQVCSINKHTSPLPVNRFQHKLMHNVLVFIQDDIKWCLCAEQ